MELERLSAELEDLQARYAFQEDTVQALNQVVAQQQRELDGLGKQCAELKQLLEQLLGEMDQLRPDEAPPHY